VLGKIIGTIVVTFFPMHDKVAEASSVADPIKAHVHGLRASLLDCVVDDVLCARVIRLDGRCRLGMSQFVESCAKHARLLAIVEQSADFGFGGRGKNVAHDAAGDVNGSVKWWRSCCRVVRGHGAEEEEASAAWMAALSEMGSRARAMWRHWLMLSQRASKGCVLDHSRCMLRRFLARSSLVIVPYVVSSQVIKYVEHRDTQKVVDRVTKSSKIDCWYGLDKLALEIGGNADVECKLFLVGQKLAVDLGDLWGSCPGRMIGSGSRMDGRIKGNSVGLD
jgi:hypothetical protein